jgi:hypothetical protein
VAARVTSQFWEIGDIVDVLEAFENSRAADELQRSAMSRQVSTGRGNANGWRRRQKTAWPRERSPSLSDSGGSSPEKRKRWSGSGASHPNQRSPLANCLTNLSRAILSSWAAIPSRTKHPTCFRRASSMVPRPITRQRPCQGGLPAERLFPRIRQRPFGIWRTKN